MSTPGWYPDATAHGQRYWDGAQWTGVAPMPLAAMPYTAPAGRQTRINYGFMILGWLSVVGTAIPAIFWFVAAGQMANDPNPDTSQTAGIPVIWGIIWLVWGGIWTAIWFGFGISRRR